MRDLVSEKRKKIFDCLESFMKRDGKDSFQHLLRHHCNVDVKNFMVTGSGLFIYLEDGTYFTIPFTVIHHEKKHEIVPFDRNED